MLHTAMVPKIQAGLFLTLTLLLSRRTDAAMNENNKGIFPFDQISDFVHSCCQDNTWDIAVAENSETPSDLAEFNIKFPPSEQPVISDQTPAILIVIASSGNTSFIRQFFSEQSPENDFSSTLFHPPNFCCG